MRSDCSSSGPTDAAVAHAASSTAAGWCALTDVTVGSALFSEDGVYRYRLERLLVEDSPLVSTVNMILLNPSTATAETDDPTIRRCMRFARAWGYGRLVVTNLYALRATDPAWLIRHEFPVGELVLPPFGMHRAVPVDRSGPPNFAQRNDIELVTAALEADRVIVGWGAQCGLRGPHVAGMLDSAGVRLESLGETKHGHPRHPLYLPSSAVPQPWPAADGGRARGGW